MATASNPWLRAPAMRTARAAAARAIADKIGRGPKGSKSLAEIDEGFVAFKREVEEADELFDSQFWRARSFAILRARHRVFRRHYLSSPDKSSAQVLKVQAMQQRAATRVADQYDTIAAGMTMEELLQWVPPGGPLPANLEEAAVRADAADGIDDLKAARTNSWGKEGKGRWSGGGGAATGAGEEDDDIELSDGWQDRMVTGERVLDQAGDRHLEGLSDMSDLENLEEDVRRARAMAGPL